MKKKYKL